MNITEESGAGKGAYTVYSISMRITLHNPLTWSSHLLSPSNDADI